VSPEWADFFKSVIVPVLTALVVSGAGVAFLRLPSDKRKMAATTEHERASAADILTGRALEMVEHSQADATAARAEALAAHHEAADARAQSAEAVRVSMECTAETMRLMGVLHLYEEFILAHGLTPPTGPSPA
jgi:hypothetical protein